MEPRSCRSLRMRGPLVDRRIIHRWPCISAAIFTRSAWGGEYQIFPHGPFRYVLTKSGLHIHHLFWGILLLMLTDFVALATRDPRWHLRIAVVFGIALGLTLDEFAMWLRLADVYWTPQGIESIKAMAVAAAILAGYGFGQPFWHAIARDVFRFAKNA